jgi:hypothetical protein
MALVKTSFFPSVREVGAQGPNCQIEIGNSLRFRVFVEQHNPYERNRRQVLRDGVSRYQRGLRQLGDSVGKSVKGAQ